MFCGRRSCSRSPSLSLSHRLPLCLHWTGHGIRRIISARLRRAYCQTLQLAQKRIPNFSPTQPDGIPTPVVAENENEDAPAGRQALSFDKLGAKFAAKLMKKLNVPLMNAQQSRKDLS